MSDETNVVPLVQDHVLADQLRALITKANGVANKLRERDIVVTFQSDRKGSKLGVIIQKVL